MDWNRSISTTAPGTMVAGAYGSTQHTESVQEGVTPRLLNLGEQIVRAEAALSRIKDAFGVSTPPAAAGAGGSGPPNYMVALEMLTDRLATVANDCEAIAARL